MTPRTRAIGYALILAPGVVGVALDVRPVVTMVAIGVVTLIASYLHVLTPPREYRRGFTENLVLGCVAVAVAVITTTLVPHRSAGLVFAAWIVLTEVVWRAWTKGAYADESYERYLESRRAARDARPG